MIPPEKLKQALNLIAKSNANYEYFFDNLDSPDWLEPLAEEGLFNSPPPAEIEGNLTHFRAWSASRYLSRMAKQGEGQAKRVYAIIARISQTDNCQVHMDLADAALYLDAEDSAMWAKKEATWVRRQEYLPLLLPDKLGAVIGSLARRDKADSACDLARALLAVKPGRIPPDHEDVQPAWRIHPTARVLFTSYTYSRVLKEHIPALVDAAGEIALLLLCDLLEQAIRLSRTTKEQGQDEDRSYIWRNAIEHDDDRRADVRDALVTAVRDAAESSAQSWGEGVFRLLEARRQHKVFRRIEFHLRRMFPGVDIEGTGHLIATRDVIEDPEFHHEVFHLLRERFSDLPESAQHGYLDMVTQGPDTEAWLNGQEKWRGARPSQGDAKAYVERWRFGKLLPIREHLIGHWKVEFERLRKDVPEPAHPDYVFYMETASVEPESPKTADDLRAMAMTELIAYLREWQPTDAGAHRGPSVEGLSHALGQIVLHDPEHYAPHADTFRETALVYVRAFLSALGDAVKQKKGFPWPPVLSLCSWVLEQPCPTHGRAAVQHDRDLDLTWSRGAVVDLVSIGLKDDEIGIPSDLAGDAWALLALLAEDDPPPHAQEVTADLVALAINNTRGKAIEAAIQYALRKRRQEEKFPDAKRRIALGFGAMTEVRDLLDRHLDPTHEQSLAIHSLYGLHFPLLSLLDNSWAAASVAKIFPAEDDDEHQRKWSAAWEAYVVYCQPYNNPFELIRREYTRAARSLETPKPERRRMADPDLHLAEHLATFYFRGKVELTDACLVAFYEHASASLRAHVLDFVGRGLRDTKDKIPQELRESLKAFWKWRLDEACKSSSPGIYSDEIASFGWWFASGKFDLDWAFAQLRAAVELAGRIDPEHEVVERLAALAPTDAKRAVEALLMIVRAEQGRSHGHTWGDDAYKLLEIALASPDDGAREQAKTTPHLLGALGYNGFRKLVKEP